jgi:hypothetical protein
LCYERTTLTTIYILRKEIIIMMTALAFLILFGTFVVMSIGDIAISVVAGFFTIILNILTGRR